MKAFSNNINFLKSLSKKKVWNAWEVYQSYKVSRLTGKPAIQGLPISISIEPTTSCNLRCPECPSGLRSFSRPTGMLSTTLFASTIDQLKDTLANLTFYFQGEPYLNPHFLEMVKYASSNRIYTSTSTNAHFLTEDNAEKTIRSGLHKLIISIDGLDQDTYASYRVGGTLNKVMEGTKNIVALKKKLKLATPHIAFQFLVVRPNEHQVKEVYKLAESLDVDEVVLKTAQIYDFKNGSPLIPSNSKYSRYQQLEDGQYVIKNKLENHCWKMWHSCVITWDGKVVPCCFDKDAHFVLGNLSNSSFRDIWNSNEYNNFRSQIIGGRNQIDMCRNCTEGTKVWG